MNVTTWNVNSIRARLERTLEWVDAREPDVLCLQEIKCLDAEFPRAKFEDRGYHVATFGQKTYNGVAILSRTPLEEVQTDLPWPGDPQSRGIAARVGGLWVVNLYVVNGGELGSDKYAYKLAWLEQLVAWVAAHQADPMVICGDFNIAPAPRDTHDPKTWEGGVLCTPAERARFEEVLALGFVDAWRHLHPRQDAWTWWDYRTNGFAVDAGLRIDHHLVSAGVLPRVLAVSIDREARAAAQASDHAPVTLHLEGW